MSRTVAAFTLLAIAAVSLAINNVIYHYLVERYPIGCLTWPTTYSIATGQQKRVVFVNKINFKIDLYRKDFAGVESKRGEIAAGQNIDMDTAVGDMWQFRSPGGQCVDVYMILPDVGLYTLSP